VGALERGPVFLLALEHVTDGLAQFARNHHIAHLAVVVLHTYALRSSQPLTLSHR
jgi:hypothetical protein